MIALVDRAIAVIDRAGVAYRVGPLETTMEGELEELLTIVKRINDQMTAHGITSTSSQIKILHKPAGASYCSAPRFSRITSNRRSSRVRSESGQDTGCANRSAKIGSESITMTSTMALSDEDELMQLRLNTVVLVTRRSILPESATASGAEP